MSARDILVDAVFQKAFALTPDYDDVDERYEFREQFILDDDSLTKSEKSKTILRLYKNCDREKTLLNKGNKRICENCKFECFATLYCEHCVRNYLKAKFSNWTSGNNDIDNLIQKCQMETLAPNIIVEWIPYSNLQNIKYLTRGGCSEIYTANWVDGCYFDWDSKKQQLIREFPNSSQYVVLKRLENVESANRSWFDEVY